MSAWPQFVPRIELDVHLKTINEHVDDLAQRIGGQHEHRAQTNADLERLHSWCKELASKAELSHLGSRLDLQIACTDASVTEGLQEVRECFASDVQRLRDDLQAQIDALKNDFSTASKEIVRLDESIAKGNAFSETTYATKAEVEAVHTSTEKSRELAYGQLRSAIDVVELDKASRAQLDEAKAALRSSDEALAKDLASTSASLSQTTQSLVFFDTLCRSTFATKAALTEVSGSISDLEQRVCQTATDRMDVESKQDAERERLQENIGSVQECWRVLHEATDDLHHLKVGRSLLAERCDKSEQELRGLSELEKKHWAEWQEVWAAQEKINTELQGAYGVLHQDVQLHIEATRQEGENLRQHSTMRYLDQIDKALVLQQTVDQVQRGHQELHESMRSIKLPKV